jgi:hypothetical protein
MTANGTFGHVSDETASNDAPLSGLAATWNRYESFRDSIRAMVEIAPTTFPRWFPVDADAAIEPTSDQEDAGVRGVLFLITNAGAYDGPTSLVDELGALYADDHPGASEEFEAARPEINRVLEAAPEIERSRRIRSVERAIFPSFVSAQSSVDMRVVIDGSEDETRLVPVVGFRVNLDEPIGAGSSISFQIPTDRLDEIIEELEIARDLVGKSREQYAEWMAE